MRAEARQAVIEAVVGPSNGGCALIRLRDRVGGPGMLSDVGVSVGLTKHESYGIMDGWDSCDSSRMGYDSFLSECDSPEHTSEYNEGYALGMHCADLAAVQAGRLS